MTEREKMVSGKLYDPTDDELAILREQAHKLSKDYNDTYDFEEEKREEILSKLIPDREEGVYLQGPIYFDYGINTKIGSNTFINFNATILDVCPVTIGSDVLIGPNVSIQTPVHPMRYQDRNIRFRQDGTPYDLEYAKPIEIKRNCWIASNVTICGGVTIGEGCVIGAGSVVTRDIPDNSFAAGVPCKVIREITEDDAIELKKELY
ncbi:MAG: sugar O-acetyltransferase [Eubacterium sp.]|nr:sugar O-acetyltransferase [Eubacterium sp.]